MRSDNQKPHQYLLLDEFGEPLRKYHTKREAVKHKGAGMQVVKLYVPKPPSVFETTEEALF